MGRIGETLRNARESKGISLLEAEEATKIRLKYLQDLENENFDNLPGRAYVIGFLRTYAKYLQIEDQALVEEYKATYRSEEYLQNQRERSTRKLEFKLPNKIYKALIVGLAVLLLIGTNYLYNNLGRGEADNQSDPPSQNIVVESPKPADREEPESTENSALGNTPEENFVENPEKDLDKVQVSIKISDAPDSKCWINVISDNKKIFSGTLTAGEEKEFEAQEKLEVKFGNAGVAYVVANGEELGYVGDNWEVVTKVFEKNSF